jgi:2'-5' RNA ligase
MRLFLAVEIPPQEQKQIYESLSPLRKQWPKIRWISSDNLHITLKFLGEVPEALIPKVKKCAEDCISDMGLGSFKLTFSQIGAFPRPKSPRVIWCGVEGDTKMLSALVEHLEPKLETLGFQKEKRPYRAHLTIAKVSPEQRGVDFEPYIKDYEKTIFAGISVNMISLMQSVLNPFGAVYQCIHQIYL